MYFITALSIILLSLTTAQDTEPFAQTVALLHHTSEQFQGCAKRREVEDVLRSIFADCFVHCDRKHAGKRFSISDEVLQSCVHRCYSKEDKKIRTKFCCFRSKALLCIMLFPVRLAAQFRTTTMLSNALKTLTLAQSSGLLSNALESSCLLRAVNANGSCKSIILARPTVALVPMSKRAMSTEVREVPPSHSATFTMERLLAVVMLPLFPTALFVHNALIDYALAATVALHIHWGLHVVVEDYARPFVVGETLSKLCSKCVYLVSILMFAGLLHFNYTDVGITKAFEMIWAL
uniref:Succinate dehydrogenase [ubiquinone] cytochrome b small subunit n=1 Tax=Trichuris muris TaxID=70415 RepID=A0A5S6QIY9_TRIMR